MRKTLLLFLFIIIGAQCVYSQAPENFTYQAIVRDSEGNILKNQDISVRVSILQNSATGEVVYSESHSTTSNSHGLINIMIGTGGIIQGSFPEILWGKAPHFVKIEIDPEGHSDYINMGTSQLLSVPYALHAKETSNTDDADADPSNEIQEIALEKDNQLSISGGNSIHLPYDSSFWESNDTTVYYLGKRVGVGSKSSNSKLEVRAEEGFTSDTLFVVKDKKGRPVFAVFPEGVRVYVDDSQKGRVGAFAVSGRSAIKGVEQDYLKVTPDSTNIIVNQSLQKGRVGAFAVSGRSATKAGALEKIMVSTPDSTRIFVNQQAKGRVGGFAVSGRSATKGDADTYFDLGESNYFIGKGAGANITTGLYNSFLGFNAGYATETGSDNIFLGYYAGYNNYGHMDSSPTPALDGSENIFIGKESGRFNLDGSNNVMIGNQAGFSNESGLNNVFIGNLAGYSNVGNGSYNGDYNVFIGKSAGESNTEGATNVFIGEAAGQNNIDGGSNVYIGRMAGRADTSGSGNTFVGNSSGYNLKGSFNTAIGIGAGSAAAESYALEYNTLIGRNAGNDLITGKQNTIIGNEAGAFIDIGRRNVIIGAEAGMGTGSGPNNPGSNNVFIGYQAGLYETDSNKLYIENSSSGSPLIYGDFANNFLVIDGDNSNGYKFYVNGDAGGLTGWNALSDRRLKANIAPIQNSLQKVMNIQGVNFEWKDKEKYGTKKEIGFIAQDLEKVLPEVVNKKGKHYSVQYGEVNALLVEAVKEQQKMIKKLEERISQLEEKLAE